MRQFQDGLLLRRPSSMLVLRWLTRLIPRVKQPRPGPCEGGSFFVVIAYPILYYIGLWISGVIPVHKGPILNKVSQFYNKYKKNKVSQFYNKYKRAKCLGSPYLSDTPLSIVYWSGLRSDPIHLVSISPYPPSLWHLWLRFELNGWNGRFRYLISI